MWPRRRPRRAVASGHDGHHATRAGGELYSYLFLAREFMDELIELGRTDAQRWLDSEHDQWPWRVGRPTET